VAAFSWKRNEYANKLEKTQFEGLVKEVTGLPSGNGTLRSIVGTFLAFK